MREALGYNSLADLTMILQLISNGCYYVQAKY